MFKLISTQHPRISNISIPKHSQGIFATVLIVGVFTLTVGSPVSAQEKSTGFSIRKTSPVMTQRIDILLRETWESEGVTPAPLASDSEFLRRARLDLTGIIPHITEIRTFLADDDPDKRAKLIDRLLNEPRHATHLSIHWRKILLPEGSDNQLVSIANIFQNWLRECFVQQKPYDQIVNELMTVTGSFQRGPAYFYAANGGKPEELAASTSRAFLGVQISCAQCHDHPFDHWKQEDFWGFAAFFGQLQKPNNPQQFFNQIMDENKGELHYPDSKEVAVPKYLGGEIAIPDSTLTRRQQLASWMTSKENPYFAKATVNRVWGLLFGRGLVNPIDDLGSHNRAIHPVLLDELAQFLIDHDFNLQLLIRTIANSHAYQLTSVVDSGHPEADQLFARMAIKSLTAEQLYDCLQEAIRKRNPGNATPNARFLFGSRPMFLMKFSGSGKQPTELQAGIPQALTMMNGSLIREATDLQQSDLLISLRAPFFTDKQRVETLFLSTLSRLPTPKEQAVFEEYVERGGPRNDLQHALGDVLWALLNSAEFMLNH